MKGYYIYVKNNLLEDKHRVAMGESLWLYLWLLDKVTVIKNSYGVVLGRKPIKYEDFCADFPTVPRRTFYFWLTLLEKNGYIVRTKTPYGSSIHVTKIAKIFKKSGVQPTALGVQPTAQGVQQTVHPSATNCTSNKDNTVDNTVDNNILHILGDSFESPEKEVSKLYYQVIKALNLPNMNNNNVRAKIKAMQKEDTPERLIRYLTFMRDHYGKFNFEYKPQVDEALDIYRKRLAIEESFKKEAARQKKKTIVEI